MIEFIEKVKEYQKNLGDHNRLYHCEEAKKKAREFREELGSDVSKFRSLNSDMRRELGFRTWDERSEQFGLIPLNIYVLLDSDEMLVCPFDADNKSEKKAVCDDDNRGGVTAYEFHRGTAVA